MHQLMQWPHTFYVPDEYGDPRTAEHTVQWFSADRNAANEAESKEDLCSCPKDLVINRGCECGGK